MTWRDWVSTTYNTGGFYIEGELQGYIENKQIAALDTIQLLAVTDKKNVCASDGSLVRKNGALVKQSDAIEKNGVYTF